MTTDTPTLIAALRALATHGELDGRATGDSDMLRAAADRLELLSEAAESLQGLHDYSVPMRGTYVSEATREWHKAEEVLRIIDTVNRIKTNGQ